MQFAEYIVSVIDGSCSHVYLTASEAERRAFASYLDPPILATYVTGTEYGESRKNFIRALVRVCIEYDFKNRKQITKDTSSLVKLIKNIVARDTAIGPAQLGKIGELEDIAKAVSIPHTIAIVGQIDSYVPFLMEVSPGQPDNRPLRARIQGINNINQTRGDAAKTYIPIGDFCPYGRDDLLNNFDSMSAHLNEQNCFGLIVDYAMACAIANDDQLSARLSTLANENYEANGCFLAVIATRGITRIQSNMTASQVTNTLPPAILQIVHQSCLDDEDLAIYLWNIMNHKRLDTSGDDHDVRIRGRIR